MQLFYNPSIQSQQQEVVFNREESKHISKVLRKKNNDKICVTNGKGLEWNGVLKMVDPRETIAALEYFKEHPRKKQLVNIAIAPTKSNERMEWFLEKATEIGINSITPLLTKHSERKVIKPERYKKILISALKQSQQFHLPKLHPMTTVQAFIESREQQPFYIAHCAEGRRTAFEMEDFSDSETTILIGPEGDFSSDEILFAENNAGISVRFGENRLRTETAGIVALNTVVLKQRIRSLTK